MPSGPQVPVYPPVLNPIADTVLSVNLVLPSATLFIKFFASSYYFLVYEEFPEAAANILVNLSLDTLVFTPTTALSPLEFKLLETPSESPDIKAFAASREKSIL